MNKMEKVVKDWILENNMLEPGDRVVCGTSGGVDSMVLLYMLKSMEKELGIKVYAGHFNHHIRAEESDRDQYFVEDTCKEWGIECKVGQGNVMGRVAETNESVEEAARNLRYEFLNNCFIGAKIATAHHANDNMETVLMNLVRGCGAQGACGIPPVRDNIIRPLLCVSREDICEFAESHGISHVEDSTNGSNDYMRNRVRHTIIPLLVNENPNAILNAFNAAQCVRIDNNYLNDKADEAFKVLTKENKGFNALELKELDGPILRRVIMRILTENDVCFSKGDVENFEECIKTDKEKIKFNLTGNRAVVNQGGQIRIFDKSSMEQVEPIKLEYSKQVPFGHKGNVIKVTHIDCASKISKDSHKLMVDASSISGNLYVRSKMDGDKIKMTGGTKSLVRVMRDKGIFEENRNNYPVICDDNGLLAVGGIGIDMNHKAEIGKPVVLIEVS